MHSPSPSPSTSPIPSPNAMSSAETIAPAERPASREAPRITVEKASYAGDVELAQDPYRLGKSLKNKDEIDGITSNTSRRRLKKFYNAQNENIERFLMPVDKHVQLARQQEEQDNLKVKIARQASFIANVLLAVLQIYGATSSLSLSLFATMADAIFDPISNFSLIFWSWRMKKCDARKYPSGNSRIEPVGNIIFCWIMSSVSAVLIAISIVELVEGVNDRKGPNPPPDTEDFHAASIIAVCIAFAVKFALFLYCWPLKGRYTQIQILWVDHRNDLFINGFGILTSALGGKLVWWIDPAGAVCLSVLVIVLWSYQASQEFKSLLGISADTQMLQWITYISATHSETIKAIDTVRAYYSGPRIIIEVDVVMDPELSLRVTHDIAEELQFKLESLADVERAYVHIDYETTHQPEHFLKKVL